MERFQLMLFCHRFIKLALATESMLPIIVKGLKTKYADKTK